MAGHKKDADHGIESAWIRELADILNDTGLTEIEIEKDGVMLRIARQGAPVAAPVHVSAPAAPAQPAAPSAPQPAAGTDHPGAVKSPMVGTVYLAPSPGADTFTKEGATVTEGQTIMIIEAMKTMNPISATRAGTVTKILVSDSQPVEYEEPLIIIE